MSEKKERLMRQLKRENRTLRHCLVIMRESWSHGQPSSMALAMNTIDSYLERQGYKG